ncbi:NUDIX hydrolase [Parafrankia sp. FMc2]|uniref:NUDIX hydrolase n=1 Tax=Parafrankia sp. FMc2 TaxID=3233196 RepID=UPI0034D74D1F
MPVHRRAARVILLDPQDAVLLIRSHDPDLAAGPAWWHVPGGGLDPGEAPADAAAREVAEEIGLRIANVGPCVATRTTHFTFLGTDYEQEEWYYVVRLPGRVEVSDADWSDVERRSTLGWRWWSLPALRLTDEIVYPGNLPALIGSWLAAGTPDQPHRLEP